MSDGGGFFGGLGRGLELAVPLAMKKYQIDQEEANQQFRNRMLEERLNMEKEKFANDFDKAQRQSALDKFKILYGQAVQTGNEDLAAQANMALQEAFGPKYHLPVTQEAMGVSLPGAPMYALPPSDLEKLQAELALKQQYGKPIPYKQTKAGLEEEYKLKKELEKLKARTKKRLSGKDNVKPYTPQQLADDTRAYYFGLMKPMTNPLTGMIVEDNVTEYQKLKSMLEQDLQAIGRGERPQWLTGSGGPKRKIVKTGTYKGRKVVQYDDGSIEYAD